MAKDTKGLTMRTVDLLAATIILLAAAVAPAVAEASGTGCQITASCTPLTTLAGMLFTPPSGWVAKPHG